MKNFISAVCVVHLEEANHPCLANMAITVPVPLQAWSLGQATCLVKSAS